MSRLKTFKTYKKDGIKTAAMTVKLVSFTLIALLAIATIFIKSKYFGVLSWDRLNQLGSHNLALKEQEYYYTVDEYINLRYENAVKNIEKLHSDGILNDKYYKYMLNGVNHDYFKNCAIIDYETYQSESDRFISICESLTGSNYSKEAEKCGEDCIFKEYLEAYINEGYRDKLDVAHTNYHKAIATQEEIYAISDDDWKFYYELGLVTNLDNIEELEIELTYMTTPTLQLNDSLVNWIVRSPLAKCLRETKTVTLDNREAIEYFNLINDAAMFDANVIEKASNIAYMLGDEIEDSTQDDVVILDISGIEDYKSYIDSKLAKKYQGTNIKDTSRFISIIISDRYEGEQLYVLFDVKKCKHKEGLLAYEECNDTEWKKAATHKMVVDSFWAEMYDTSSVKEQ